MSGLDAPAKVKAVPGSILLVASSLIRLDEARTRERGAPRTAGTITRNHFDTRVHGVKEFLRFLNERHGPGAVARMTLADLTMHDVEAYNREIVTGTASYSHVNKRMAVVKDIIDRSGRPEHGSQVLGWNWEARDKTRGTPPKSRQLPTLPQLKKILRSVDARGKALVWMGIGLGFGQGDISVTLVGQIDAQGYDLRRGKTGIERYGETAPMVWRAISDYLAEEPRPDGELLFVTERARPLVHGKRCDAIRLWWKRLRAKIGESKDTLSGFYVLRHLGATEFGSRDGCSLGAMRRWLGHTSSSNVADVYMRPVAPEYRQVIEWKTKHKALRLCSSPLLHQLKSEEPTKLLCRFKVTGATPNCLPSR